MKKDARATFVMFVFRAKLSEVGCAVARHTRACLDKFINFISLKKIKICVISVARAYTHFKTTR